MARQPEEIKIVHAAADYYEPLFRARFVRAMKTVQKQVSINNLAVSIASNARQAKDAIPRKIIIDALNKEAKKVIRDAFMRGGKLGADHVHSTLK